MYTFNIANRGDWSVWHGSVALVEGVRTKYPQRLPDLPWSDFAHCSPFMYSFLRPELEI